MRTRTAAAAALPVLAVALAGCANGGKPNYSTIPPPTRAPSSTPAPTTTPSPSVITTGPNLLPGATRPVEPAGLRQRTQAGASETAQYFYTAIDWGYSTGDASPLRAISAPGCTPCGRLVEIFDEAVAAHQHFKGGHISRAGFADVPTADAALHGEKAADTKLNIDPLTLLSDDGKVKEGPYPAKSYTQRAYVRWLSGSWKITMTARVRTG